MLNVGSMAAAYVAASVVPFELLLAAYAFLGPAHYLTQISWLHDRSYFCSQRLPLLVLVGLATAAVTLHPAYWDLYIWVAVSLALALTLVRAAAHQCVLFLILSASYFAVYVPRARASLILVSLLPTIIHVYVFTWFFMLHGYLRNRDRWALAALLLMPLAALSYLVVPVDIWLLAPSWAQKNIGLFSGIADDIDRVFGFRLDDLHVNASIKIIAFAYTYHYLNWFAKTGIIGWHRMSHRRLFAMVASYAVFVGIYAVDYQAGFQALFFLSVLHVVLELPLDVVTIRSILGRAMPQPAALVAR